MLLNENLFEDMVVDSAEDVLASPEQGEDIGIAELLMNLIKDEYEAIQGYNGFLANIGSHEEMKSTIEDINSEENKHIGQLQALLKTISPNVEAVETGIQEGEEMLDKAIEEDHPIDESLNEKVEMNTEVITEKIENVEKVLTDSPKELDAITTLNTVMADAVKSSEKLDNRTEKFFKQARTPIKRNRDGKVEPFLGAKEQPVPADPVWPKVKLEESLFEDVDSDKIAADEIFKIVNNSTYNSEAFAYMVDNRVFLIDKTEDMVEDEDGNIIGFVGSEVKAEDVDLPSEENNSKGALVNTQPKKRFSITKDDHISSEEFMKESLDESLFEDVEVKEEVLEESTPSEKLRAYFDKHYDTKEESLNEDISDDSAELARMSANRDKEGIKNYVVNKLKELGFEEFVDNFLSDIKESEKGETQEDDDEFVNICNAYLTKAYEQQPKNDEEELKKVFSESVEEKPLDEKLNRTSYVEFEDGSIEEFEGDDDAAKAIELAKSKGGVKYIYVADEQDDNDIRKELLPPVYSVIYAKNGKNLKRIDDKEEAHREATRLAHHKDYILKTKDSRKVDDEEAQLFSVVVNELDGTSYEDIPKRVSTDIFPLEDRFSFSDRLTDVAVLDDDRMKATAGKPINVDEEGNEIPDEDNVKETNRTKGFMTINTEKEPYSVDLVYLTSRQKEFAELVAKLYKLEIKKLGDNKLRLVID